MKVIINQDGRILIPKIIRKSVGFAAGDVLTIKVVDNKIIVSKEEK